MSKAKQSMSEMILAAVFHLQQKNGISVVEIANYVGEKRCCDPSKLCPQIQLALLKAKEHGIVSESKGLYRIENPYNDKMRKSDLKPRTKGDEEKEDENFKKLVCIMKEGCGSKRKGKSGRTGNGYGDREGIPECEGGSFPKKSKIGHCGCNCSDGGENWTINVDKKLKSIGRV